MVFNRRLIGRVVTALCIAAAVLSPAAHAGAAVSQVIAAGTSATNLPTEATWPGAQNPPYVCCWNIEGKYVTFSFTVPAGSTEFSLRYSAGNGPASRTVELDGAEVAPDQQFPATADWSTWATSTLTETVAAGTHHLKVWFHAPAGSTGWMNLDNLTVTPLGAPTAPPGVVSVGYVDGTTGLTPWQGSPDTTFIGTGPQCCLSHGPGLGQDGYDGGVIEITNPTASPITVDSMTVDFGGTSDPSHFDEWGGNLPGTLPATIAPGGHLVLTAMSAFSFDSSDFNGEACHPNAGVAGVVHVSMDGVVTDYVDDHQILNSDGADTAACPGIASEQKDFTALEPGTQAQVGPVEDLAPGLLGPAVQNRVISAFSGAWNASPAPAVAMQWMRCDAGGASCVPIPGATAGTYVPRAADVGHTLRMHVEATNAVTTAVDDSAPSALVQAGPDLGQLGDTATGFTSVLVEDPVQSTSLFTAVADGATVDFSFFARGAGETQTFTPKVYAAANRVQGALLATGAPIDVPLNADARWYTSALSGVHLRANQQYVLAVENSGGFNGTYLGAEPGGPLALFVDYTPAVVPGAPAAPSATAGDAQASLSWSAPSDGGATIDHYTITPYRGGVAQAPVVTPDATTTFMVTGLTNRTAYTFTVAAHNSAGNGPPSPQSNAVTPTEVNTYFHALAPTRILDSRAESKVGAYGSPWTTGMTRDVAVGGLANVPVNADAVVLNVTVTGTTGSSFLSIWPAGQPKPTVSSLNWTPGQTIPNAVTVKLGAGGKISIFNLSGSVNVIADVSGYYDKVAGDGFTAASPERILDSRPDTKVGSFGTPWGAGTVRSITVGGAAGVPADADAVVLNVTVTDTTQPSFLTVWPTGQPQPTASSLNWTPGVTIPNAVTVKLGTDGKISIFNLSGGADVIADVAGYYKAGSGNAFHPINPGRALDSRLATQVGSWGSPWGPATGRNVFIGGVAGVPLYADAVVLNTTVTDTTQSSFLTVWPAGITRPTASSLNWTPGVTIPNAVTVKLGTAGKVSVYNLLGSVDVIMDAGGWFG